MTKLTYNVDGFNIIEEVREITPQEASEILATKNVKNRKTNKNHVNALALNMTNGTWRYNADPIRFDANDVLIDGQHRLFAVVMAQKPILFKIVRGLDPEAFKVIDMEAKSRNLADLFKIDGIPHYTGIASIIGRYYLLNQGRTAMSNQTADGLHGGGKAQSFTTIEQRYDFFYQNRYVVEEFFHNEWALFLRICKCLADLSFDLLAKLHIVSKELLHSLATLRKLALAVAEPGTALLDDVVLDTEVDDLSDL